MPRKPKEENDQLAKAIGGRLELAMRRRNATVSDLHKLTGISRTVLLAYTRGNYAPGARELRLLCEKLDVSPTVLLFGTEKVGESPHRIGQLAIDSEVSRTMTYSLLLGHLTHTEQAALLTLAEALVEARDPQAHQAVVAALNAVLEDQPMQEMLTEVSGRIEAQVDKSTPALEAKISKQLKGSAKP